MPFSRIIGCVLPGHEQSVLNAASLLASRYCLPLSILAADKASNVSNPGAILLPEPPPQAWTAEWMACALFTRLSAVESFLLLLPASDAGTEIGARLSQQFACPFLPDLRGEILVQEQCLSSQRHILSGQALEKLEARGPRVIVTIASREEYSGTPTQISALNFPPASDSADLLVRVLSRRPSKGTQSNLQSARIVVAGGAGMGGVEGFDLLRRLCNVLGASLAASRAAVNCGWISAEHQVGLSGKIITPEVYIACGISGSVQHQAGMRGARFIAAINRDPAAPIFRIADLGIIGDVFSVLKQMIRLISQAHLA